jgi:hypothetical protein
MSKPEQTSAERLSARIDAIPPRPETVETRPVPKVSNLEAAFGSIEHLPPWAELSDEEKRGDGPFCDAAQMLFFKGGKFSDYGLTPKPGVYVAEVVAVVRACLGSFEPKHEHKIGGVGKLLSYWFDAKEGASK